MSGTSKDICAKDHDPGTLPASFRALPQSQKRPTGRHVCAACAYELGRKEATEAEERLRKRVQDLMAENERLKQENDRLKAGKK